MNAMLSMLIVFLVIEITLRNLKHDVGDAQHCRDAAVVASHGYTTEETITENMTLQNRKYL